jgi:glycine dehydrogenase subunit 1
MTYVPTTPEERAAMLEVLGMSSAEELFDVIPSEIRFPGIDIGCPLGEMEVTEAVEALAAMNRAASGVPMFLGAGAYRHFIPSAVGAVLGRSEFATAYTPYQPEVSQGTLQASFEFQSLICDLTAMEVTNASVYDGASAVAEAVLMALRLTGRERVVLSGGVAPRYRDTLKTYVGSRAVEIETTSVRSGADGEIAEDDVAAAIDEHTACCVVSQPTFFGAIADLGRIVEAAHRVGALVVFVYNPTSLGILRPPGAWGADIAVAEGQPLGIPLSFGGPYVGLMSCRAELVRQMPGRIVGQTIDAQGRRGFVLTLQAREQHIRREKATSNICTSQTLISFGVAAYLALLGPGGLRDVAEACARRAREAAERLAGTAGVQVITPRPFFHEFAVRTSLPAAEVNRRLLERGIIGGYALGADYPGLDDALLFCCTEVTTPAQIETLSQALRDINTGGTQLNGAGQVSGDVTAGTMPLSPETREANSPAQGLASAETRSGTAS